MAVSPEIVERYETILAIVKRAQKMGIAKHDQFTQFMDMEAACNEFDLRLHSMLVATDFNFAHDFVGIQSHIDRSVSKFSEDFIPRFSGMTA